MYSCVPKKVNPSLKKLVKRFVSYLGNREYVWALIPSYHEQYYPLFGTSRHGIDQTVDEDMAAKATTIKDALRRWEEKHDQNISEATEVFLCFQWPPIEKMDNSLAVLSSCTRLSLSTNMIEKISGIGSLKNLKILSVGRNYIKSFAGLEPLGDTLEELWISYNLIEKLKGVNVLRNLKVLFMSNNIVRDWTEFNKLQELPNLEDVLFVGNPLYESMEEATWKIEAVKRLPNLRKLDGEPVIHEDTPPSVPQSATTPEAADS